MPKLWLLFNEWGKVRGKPLWLHQKPKWRRVLHRLTGDAHTSSLKETVSALSRWEESKDAKGLGRACVFYKHCQGRWIFQVYYRPGAITETVLNTVFWGYTHYLLRCLVSWEKEAAAESLSLEKLLVNKYTKFYSLDPLPLNTTYWWKFSSLRVHRINTNSLPKDEAGLRGTSVANFAFLPFPYFIGNR